VSRYQKGKTNLDFTEARDSEWQWHQLGHMHVSTSLQTDNHVRTPPLSFLQAGCPSCRPTNSVIALKANQSLYILLVKYNNNNRRFTAIIQVSLRWPTPPVMNWLIDFVCAKFYCPHAVADGSRRIRIRGKTLEFSSTVSSTLSL